jgi:hypothetical protein
MWDKNVGVYDKKAETSEGQRNNKASEGALAVRNGRIKLNEVRKRERKKEERKEIAFHRQTASQYKESSDKL